MRRLGFLSVVLCGAAAFAQPLDGGGDDGGQGDAGAPDAPTAVMAIEEFEPAPMAVEAFAEADAGAPLAVAAVERFAEAPVGPKVRLYGFASGYATVDTRFDSPRGAALAENVAEARARVLLGADVKLTERLRVVLEGRAQVRGATQREFDRLKGFFEPMLGDAFVDLYTPKVDLRVGNQRVALGANAALAPADALNPRDLRESLVAGELDEALLPVFAVRAQGELGGFSWLAAYVPFFTPHRAFVFGQDEGLLQPALGQSFDNTRLDPSIEDFLQDRVLETRRPPPFAGDVALRVSRAGRVRVGASWVWLNEKLPRVRLDPELSAVLSAQAAGRAVDPAASLSVLNRFQAGETLYQGTYGRSHLFSLEASTLLGPGQLDVDVTFSPRQTLYDAGFAPIDKPVLTWVLGYSQASDSPLEFAVTYLGMLIPDVQAREQLMLLEPATAVGAARTGVFHLFLGTAAYPVIKGHLELALRAAFEPIQRSFALAPRVSWLTVPGLRVFLTAEFYEGSAWSVFGYLGRNDRVLLGARYELF